MKKILVTGASGFTGGYLSRRLRQQGHEVRALVLPGMDVADLKAEGIHIIEGDLRQKESLLPAVQGVDLIYHIAAVYREENIPQKTFWDVNVDGTRNLLETAKTADVGRFIHCSTVGVQGEIDNPPANEEAPYNPGDYYQSSKMEGELLALDFFRRENLPGVVFRPVGIYGPGEMRFLKIFRYIHQGKFRMIGSGKILYHLTYIDDLIDGILLVGETPDIEGEIFTLAGERYTTLNELVATIADVLNATIPKRHIPAWPVWLAGAACEYLCRPFRINPPLYRRRVDFFIKDRAFSIDKAKRVLGYRPKTALRDGLLKTAEWYKAQGLLD